MKFAFIFIFLFAHPAFAIKNGEWFIGSGILNHNIGKVSGDSSGQTSILGNNYYLPIQMKVYFGFGGPLHTMLKAMYTPISRATPDGGAQTSMLFLSGPSVYTINKNWDVDLGLSWLLYIVRGAGGTTTQNNGAGVNTTYGLPARYEMSKNLIIEAGGSYTNNKTQIELNLLVLSPLTNRRAFSLLLTYNYKFAGG